jgi:hypothetical protein
MSKVYRISCHVLLFSLSFSLCETRNPPTALPAHCNFETISDTGLFSQYRPLDTCGFGGCSKNFLSIFTRGADKSLAFQRKQQAPELKKMYLLYIFP